jgi:Ca-activated chloride channel family protein
MSFAAPLVLLALAAIPVMMLLYGARQRTRGRVAAAFVAAPLTASVVPRQPRWRRHVPALLLALALAVLIVAAARPQTSRAVVVNDGAVILANDVSSSMAATDVAPSRLGAARRADGSFLAHVPGSVRVGLLEFDQTATVLQSPTLNRSLTRGALANLHADGHTAIGTAVGLAARLLTAMRAPNGKRIPAAIVLLSDGSSTNGLDPVTAARQAAADHIPVYTVALGTAHGTIVVHNKDGTTKTVPVPLDPQELQEIARVSKGRTFTAADSADLSAVYDHLAAQLGHTRVKHEVTASFAGAGLVLMLIGAALSLFWFRRLV